MYVPGVQMKDAKGIFNNVILFQSKLHKLNQNWIKNDKVPLLHLHRKIYNIYKFCLSLLVLLIKRPISVSCTHQFPFKCQPFISIFLVGYLCTTLFYWILLLNVLYWMYVFELNVYPWTHKLPKSAGGQNPIQFHSRIERPLQDGKKNVPTCSIEDLQWRHAMTSSTDVRHVGGIFVAPRGMF
jgi:hypothetical protein